MSAVKPILVRAAFLASLLPASIANKAALTLLAAASSSGVYCVPNGAAQACVRVSLATSNVNGTTTATLRLANLQGTSQPGVAPVTWARFHTVELLARADGQFQGGAVQGNAFISVTGQIEEIGDGVPNWGVNPIDAPGEYVGYSVFTDIEFWGAEIVGCTNPPDLSPPFFKSCDTNGGEPGDFVIQFTTAGVWDASQVALVFGIQDPEGETGCGVNGSLWTHTDTPLCITPSADPPLTVNPIVDARHFHTCVLKPDGTVECWGNGGAGNPPANSGTFARLSVGAYYFQCGLRADRTVYCWGNNDFGQAAPPAGLLANDIAAAGSMTCAVELDGNVDCWGYDTDTQLAPPNGASPAVQITGGTAIGCMLRADTTVACWGFAGHGILNIPPGLSGVTQVSARDAHACALKSDGTVACWGGGGNEDGRATPPPALQGVIQVSAGSTHSCALRANATVTCWGANDLGQTSIPAGLTSVIHVSAGNGITCALRSDQTVVCWGKNDFGQADVPVHLRPTPLTQVVNITSTPPSPALTGNTYGLTATGGGSGNPVTFSSLTAAVCTVAGSVVQFVTAGTCTIAANQAASLLYAAAPQVTQSFSIIDLPPLAVIPIVEARHFHTCVLKPDGTVECWGNGGAGNPPSNSGTFARLSVGAYYFQCGTRADHTVSCWGNNDFGQATPPVGLRANDVAAAGSMTCAVELNGNVVCWGYDTDTQLAPPNGPSSAVQVTGGTAIGCMLRADTTVACWGFAGHGILNIPPGLSGVTQVSARDAHACALKSDGTVACWGGGGNEDGRGTPPPGLQGVVQVSAGSNHSCARLAAGTVTCWGANDLGQTSVPLGLASVVHVSAGTSITCALRSDYTVVCWGKDDFGQATVPAHLRPTPLPQTISFTSSAPTAAHPTDTYTVSATGGGSGSPILFSSLTPSVCSIAGGTATMSAVGTCTIAADQAGAGLYGAATQATQSFAVTMIPQTLAFTGTLGNTFPTGSSALTATGGGSGNPIVFSSLTPPVCSVSGSTVSYLTEGTCTVAADQTGNAVYEPAAQVTRSASIARLAQFVSISVPLRTPMIGGFYDPTVTTSSGLPVTLVSQSSSCTVAGARVTYVDIGLCTFQASQAGNAKYLPAANTMSFNVYYPFNGFLTPAVNLPGYNTAKAGVVVTVRFTLGGDRGLNVLSSAGSGVVTTNGCPGNAIAPTTTSEPLSGLKYDSKSGVYSYVWRTSTDWKGTCRQLVLVLSDGIPKYVNYLFTK